MDDPFEKAERSGLLRNVLQAADRVLDVAQPGGVRAMDRGGFLVVMRHCTATVSMFTWQVFPGVQARQDPHSHPGYKRIGVEEGVLIVRAGTVEVALHKGESLGVSPGTLHTMVARGPAQGWATLEPPDPALCHGLGCSHG